jgi:trimeric autotransporter adhesin
MSTKTTFKRIALVAVAALGLGVLTSAPSQAADTSTTASTFTASLRLAHTSATVVGYDNSNPTFSAAIFSMTAIGNNGESAALFTTNGGETITASVVGVPAVSGTNATPSASDLVITPVSGVAGSYANAASDGANAASTGGSAIISSSSTGAADNARISAGTVGTRPASVYNFAVTPNAGQNFAGKAVDAGTYTIRIRLTDNTGFTTSYNVSVNFVASAADSGAVIVPTVTGRYLEGETSIGHTSTRRITAALSNANGGRVFAAGSVAFRPVAPTLSAAITTSAGVVRSYAMSVDDNGTAATDHIAPTVLNTYTNGGGTSTTVTLTQRENAAAAVANIDGTYGIKSSATLPAPTATGDLLRVRYGATSATTAFTIVPTPAGNTTATATISATGKLDTSAIAATLPLTTTSVTFTNTVVTTGTTTPATGYDVYYTLTYTGCTVTADQSPLATTAPVKLVTDSAGQVSVTVTSRKPVTGCAVAVAWSGTTAGSVTETATWAKPAATTVLASTGSYQALAKSAHTITWTVTDQFGAAFANEAVTFTASGANIPTAGLTSSVTDANGQVTFAWTDAAAVPASTTVGTTSIALATVGGVAAPTNAAVVITYKATLDVVASLRATYTDGSAQVLVPTTNIGGVDGRAVSAADQIDTTKVVTGGTPSGNHWVQLTFTALNSALTAVTGVPTTVTVTGAQLIGSNGKLGNSVVLYSNNPVWVLGTKTGVATVTATNGTLTSKATINFVNVAGDARVLSLKESAGLVTATVADAFGNGVAAVTVTLSGTGGAWFGNGATSTTGVTGLDGTVTFAITGAGTVSASIATAKTDRLANAGDALGAVVTTGAPAGVGTASVATLGRTDAATATANANAAAIAALKAQLDAAAAKAAADKASSDAAIAAAQAAAVEAATAAADAAAEATDAANAATDAANASAEAGDAATAAAQDAADAVAALATQVSEMIDTLKKQITALTNLVIKIQKKVKA